MNLLDSLLGIVSPRHRKLQEMRRKSRAELDSLYRKDSSKRSSCSRRNSVVPTILETSPIYP
jgi:hypothetical protein